VVVEVLVKCRSSGKWWFKVELVVMVQLLQLQVLQLQEQVEVEEVEVLVNTLWLQVEQVVEVMEEIMVLVVLEQQRN
jgi:hypothetical protein